MIKYIAWWFPMLLIAIVNGILREGWFKKNMSFSSAHQLSTATLILLFAVYMGFLFRNIKLTTASQAIAVGLMWMVMTLAFEFGFGRWRGNSWQALFQEYNLLEGRLWVLVPLWIIIAPYLYYRMYAER